MEGIYANHLAVGYNAFELVFDFGQCYQESPEDNVNTRIVTSPAYAKAMVTTMRAAIDAFEDRFGAIPAIDEDES